AGLSFVFQAEDGIRYATVTGVQTCALPIFGALLSRAPHLGACGKDRSGFPQVGGADPFEIPHPICPGIWKRCCSVSCARCWSDRSEERRVGKECGGR